MPNFLNPLDSPTAIDPRAVAQRDRQRRGGVQFNTMGLPSLAEVAAPTGENTQQQLLGERLNSLLQQRARGFSAFSGYDTSAPNEFGKSADWVKLQQAIPQVAAAAQGKTARPPAAARPQLPGYLVDSRMQDARGRAAESSADASRQQSMDLMNDLSAGYSSGDISSPETDRLRALIGRRYGA